MKPWQRAKKWHIENGGDVPFEQLIGGFIANGYLWNSPDEFILAKKVRVEKGRLADGPVNCWFVHLGAGKEPFKRFLAVADEPLEYVCWNRQGKPKLHIYKWERFKKRISKGD